MPHTHTLPNGRVVALGRKPHRHDPRTLQLARYVDLAAVLPQIPDSWSVPTVDNISQMYLNDKYGDCTCAALGHATIIQTMTARALVVPTDDQVLKLYEQVTAEENNGQGFDPATGDNDNGAEEVDVLRLWRSEGFAGIKINAFAEVNTSRQDLLRAGAYLFDGLYFGVALPISAQAQTGPGKVWDVADGSNGQPGSWGGHAIWLTAFDKNGVEFSTWGARQRATWAWVLKYADHQVGGEAWAVISEAWQQPGLKINGFDYAALGADLAQVGKTGG